MDIASLTALASLGGVALGALARGYYANRTAVARIAAERAKLDTSAQSSDAQMARDVLWRELTATRERVAALETRLEESGKREVAIQRELERMRYSHESVTQQLREVTDERDALARDRDAWKERASELGAKLLTHERESGVVPREPTGRHPTVKP